MKIRFLSNGEEKAWDDYVWRHPKSTHCHLSSWRQVIENTYGHKTYYLRVENEELLSAPIIAGILPLVHIKSLLFGNSLVSMPFLNYGGIIADNEDVEEMLLGETVRLGRQLQVNVIELRHLNTMHRITGNEPRTNADKMNFIPRTNKVRMLLEIPGSSEDLFKSLSSKLRSQIRRPQKEGMTFHVGGSELLNDFYNVFSVNMRDLGSPVHSIKLFKNMIDVFGENIKLGVVKYNDNAVASGLIICFRDCVEIPWASSLKEYNRLSPNMLLYWGLLEYAANSGHKYFDFGRSTPDEGTFKFKEQWGAKPGQLYWYQFSMNARPRNREQEEKEPDLFLFAVSAWKKIPLPVANLLGPLLRKSISL